MLQFNIYNISVSVIKLLNQIITFGFYMIKVLISGVDFEL